MRSIYKTLDCVAKHEYPGCVFFYTDGIGHVAFRSKGFFHWWRWDPFRGKYVKSGTTLTAEGATRKRLDQ
jgi:hypothetical protein